MKVLLAAFLAALIGFVLAAFTGWPSHAGTMFFFNVGKGGGGGAGGSPTLSISGPTNGYVGLPSAAFSVSLSNAIFNGSQTVTVSDGASGGTFTPSVGAPGVSSVTVTPAGGSSGFSFTYTAAGAGAVTLTVTNGQGWVNPAPVTYTAGVLVTGFTATGPATGTTGSPSSNFTVTLTPGGAVFSGTDTITLSDSGGGGTFTPSVGSAGVSSVIVTPAGGATSFTFTYKAFTNGAYSISFTNAQGWANAAPLTYTFSPPAACSNKLDFTQACNSQYIGAIL